MRFSALAALPLLPLALGQEASPSPDASATASGSSASSLGASAPPSSFGAGPASSAAPVPSAGASGNGTAPAAGGNSTSSGGFFASLSPQCQSGVLGILIGGESATCLQGTKLISILRGGAGASAPSVSASSAVGSSSATASGYVSAVGSAIGSASASASGAASSVMARGYSDAAGASSPLASATASAAGSAVPPIATGEPAPGSSGSSIPAIDAYLTSACGAAPCSNETITQIAMTIINSCQTDLTAAGITNDTVKIVAQMYPLVREKACLKAIPASAPVYDPTAFGPGQSAGNATAPAPSGSVSILPAASSGAAVSSGVASASAAVSSAASSASAYAKRQDEDVQADPGVETSSADASASPSPAADASSSPAASASPAITSAAGNATAPAGNGTAPAGGNATSPATGGNSTTFCVTDLLKGLETFVGQPLSGSQLLSFLTDSTERAKLADYPAANLCTECVYSGASLANMAAPFLLTLPVNPTQSLGAWYSGTCPAANLTTNGTITEGVEPSAQQSTFGFPVTFYNQTTLAWETTTPANESTPIGAGNGTDSEPWPFPQPNSTSTDGAGAVNGTAPTEPGAEPTPAVETPAAETPAAETPAAETPAAETPAAESPAAETPAAETPAAETPAAEATPTAGGGAGTDPSVEDDTGVPVERRRLRFERA